MQQVLELTLFVLSNVLLLVFIMLIFSNPETIRYFGLRLTRKQIIIFITLEVLLFVIMFINYEAIKSPDIADSFAWHYSIIYARGILPIISFSYINDKIFTFKDPIFICLVSGLIIDFIVFWLLSRIADIVKK
jgi:hypothetical protein